MTKLAVLRTELANYRDSHVIIDSPPNDMHGSASAQRTEEIESEYLTATVSIRYGFLDFCTLQGHTRPVEMVVLCCLPKAEFLRMCRYEERIKKRSCSLTNHEELRRPLIPCLQPSGRERNPRFFSTFPEVSTSQGTFRETRFIAMRFAMSGGDQHGFHKHQRVKPDNREECMGKNPPSSFQPRAWTVALWRRTHRDTAPMEWPIPISLLFVKSSCTGRFSPSLKVPSPMRIKCMALE